ncbi:hypothetical protein Q9189_007994 [Teloschistes chrysophthalmus]
MTTTLTSALKRGKSFFASTPQEHEGGFTKAPSATTLFPQVDPTIDGEDCLHDCESCTVKYPNKFKVDEEEKLYGHVNGWATHMLVATGKTDWVRDVSDEKGSVMEAVRDCGVEPTNGKLMLSASNIPLPSPHQSPSAPTTILLLPAFTVIENVTPASVPSLIKHYINTAPTNTTPLPPSLPPHQSPPPNPTIPPTQPSPPNQPREHELPFFTHPSPHTHLLLLCSQRTRDARCGISAPLLAREFGRHLRARGLYRDIHDERPGGVGIYFISHVGGHKFAANVLVYRRGSPTFPLGQGEGGVGGKGEEGGGVEGVGKVGKGEGDGGMGEATQCIWLARVRPEDCENIIRFTVLQGKIVKPNRQLRGGFDRKNQIVSW